MGRGGGGVPRRVSWGLRHLARTLSECRTIARVHVSFFDA